MKRNEIYEGQWVRVKSTYDVKEVLHKGLIFIKVQEPADWDDLGSELRLPFELEPYSDEERIDKMLTNREYIEAKGNICPKCTSGQVEATDSVHVIADGAYQNVVCLMCKFEWQEQYELVGFEETK